MTVHAHVGLALRVVFAAVTVVALAAPAEAAIFYVGAPWDRACDFTDLREDGVGGQGGHPVGSDEAHVGPRRFPPGRPSSGRLRSSSSVMVRAGDMGAPAGTFYLPVAGGAGGVDFVRLGALSVKTGAAGVLYFDEFVSQGDADIGP